MLLFFVLNCLLYLLFRFCFFFSSRRRHTRWPRDWSSDVCSSDLGVTRTEAASLPTYASSRWSDGSNSAVGAPALPLPSPRSEERRVGKECRSRWSPYR